MMNVKSTVSSVLFYSDKVIIERKVRTTLVQGENYLVIDPVEMILEIIDIDVTGEAEIKNFWFENYEIPIDEIPPLDYLELKKIMDALIDKLNMSKLKKHILEEEISSTIQSINLAYKFFSMEKITKEAMEERISFMKEKMMSNQRDLREVEKEISKLESKIAFIKSELDDWGKSYEVGRIVLTLQSADKATVDINIKFLSPVGSWRPKYKLIVNDNCRLVYQVEAEQKSPFVWENIHIGFTTEKTQKAHYITPEPWYIEPMRRRPVMVKAMKGVVEKAEFREPEPAVISEYTSIFTLIYDKPVTLKPKTSIIIDIASYKLDPKIYYVWYPYMNNKVYEIAEFNSPQDLPASECLVLHHNKITNKFDVDYIPKGSTVRWVTRWEKGVFVERKLLSREDKTKGILSGEAYIRLEYGYTIENKTERDIDIKVFERIPKPRDPKIKVKVDRAEPQPIINNLNIAEWNLNIKAQQKVDLRLKYTIYFPPDYRIPV